MHTRVWLIGCVAAVTIAAPGTASAFCGFYVAGADTDLYNNATMVTLVRDGTTTVLSMRNNYQGPADGFAMVVPVPVVLQEDNVKTLAPEIFERVDRLAAPRLVEYWEQDPCTTIGTGNYGTIGYGSGTGSGYGVGAGRGGMKPKVVVEAEFAVGEYEIVILSATDALALETWITEHDYKIPDGAAPYLRPYVEGGWKFFVARVDPAKVTFKDGMAQLSPLRFHYDSEKFVLPVRLGLINSSGTQDLIVHILARQTRFQVANYDNVTIPTNLIVDDSVRERFGEMYAALFDATLEKNPNAVVTEYAWDSGKCDPCPASALTGAELATLGLDVLGVPQAPRIVMKPVEVGNPGLDATIIRRYLRRKQAPLKYCYEKRLPGAPALAGTVRIDLTIGADGTVLAAAAEGLGDAQVEECMADTAKTIKFPKPKSGGIVKASYSIDVRPTGGASSSMTGWVLTRLHARYSADSLGQDLIFEKAEAIVGGRGGAGPELSKVAEPSEGTNAFQGRYIIRHEWTGEMSCQEPRRGMWGGPPAGVDGDSSPTPALDLAFAARGGVQLATVVREPTPVSELIPKAQPASIAQPVEAAPETTPSDEPKAPPADRKSRKGCGCASSDGAGTLWLVALFALLFVPRRSRPDVG